HFGAVLAEASCSGISGAMLTSTVRSSLRALLPVELSLGEVVERLNQLLCQDVADTGMFVTAVFLQFERPGGLLRYVSAGHSGQLLCRAGSGEIRELLGDGLAAGVVAEARYAERQILLEP